MADHIVNPQNPNAEKNTTSEVEPIDETAPARSDAVIPDAGRDAWLTVAGAYVLSFFTLDVC